MSIWALFENEVYNLKIHQDDLTSAIGRYVTHIETGETSETCKCEWLEERNTGLKTQRIEENLECPVHTKEGFLLGFFRWMFPDADEQPTVPLPASSVGATMMIHPLPKVLPEPIHDLSAALKLRIEQSDFRQQQVSSWPAEPDVHPSHVTEGSKHPRVCRLCGGLLFTENGVTARGALACEGQPSAEGGMQGWWKDAPRD